MSRRLITALALLALLPGCGTLPAITLPSALVTVASAPGEAAPAAGAPTDLARPGDAPRPATAQLAQAGGVSASWLGGTERAALERALRRYLEASTPDGRIEITRVEIEQKLFGARYRFNAVKRVIRPRVTIVHRVVGVYNKNQDRIVELRETEVIDPR